MTFRTFCTIVFFLLSSSSIAVAQVRNVLELKHAGESVTRIAQDWGWNYGPVPFLGDIDGDGKDDFMYYKKPFRVLTVVFGTSELPFTVEGDQLRQLEIEVPRETFHIDNRSYGSAGDVDRDGYDDFFVAAPYGTNDDRGLVLLIFGRSSLPKRVSVEEILDESNHGAWRVLRFIGPEGVRAGRGVSEVGDLNGDGKVDFAISCFGRVVYVIYGGFSLENDIDLKDVGTTVPGVAVRHTDHVFGRSPTGIGDINDDGFDDFAVRAPMASDPLQAGIVFVVFGGPDIPAEILLESDGPDADRSITFERPSFVPSWGQFGWGLSAAGDVDRDGIDDFLIGAPGDPTAWGTGAGGHAILVYGQRTWDARYEGSSYPRHFGLEGSAPSAYERGLGGLRGGWNR